VKVENSSDICLRHEIAVHDKKGSTGPSAPVGSNASDPPVPGVLSWRYSILPEPMTVAEVVFDDLAHKFTDR
jgi:hypothetical protein